MKIDSMKFFHNVPGTDCGIASCKTNTPNSLKSVLRNGAFTYQLLFGGNVQEGMMTSSKGILVSFTGNKIVISKPNAAGFQTYDPRLQAKGKSTPGNA